MNNLFLITTLLCLGVLVGGCSIQSSQINIRYPDNIYQKPFLQHPYESAPLSRHDQRWNPQLAGW